MITMRSGDRVLETRSWRTPEATSFRIRSLFAGGCVATCDACQMQVIQGLPCHEAGCPEAWADEIRECEWCGSAFMAFTREKESTCCSCCCDAAYYGFACDCPSCTELNSEDTNVELQELPARPEEVNPAQGPAPHLQQRPL